MKVGRPAPAGTDLGLISSALTVALTPWLAPALRRSSIAAAILRASSTSIELSPSQGRFRHAVDTYSPCRFAAIPFRHPQPTARTDAAAPVAWDRHASVRCATPG